MTTGSCVPGTLTFLELALLPQKSLEQAEVVIHSIEGSPGRCFGIRVNGAWLRGGNGFPARFQTSDAVVRLTELLRIPMRGPGVPRQTDSEDKVRCYRLHDDALAQCRAFAVNEAEVVSVFFPDPDICITS